MGKNKYVDLFKDMIPAADQGIKELWDAAGPEGQKEIKGDLWNLVRYMSVVKSNNRELQEHYLLTVNEFFNKNWLAIQGHPKLQWMLLCLCSYNGKDTFFHEWVPLKRTKNRKEEVLSNFFPTMKISDIETLAIITTEQEIKEYAKGLGWDKKQINELKL